MFQLICRVCDRGYPANEPRWQCDGGHILDLQFTPRFPLEKIKNRPPSMWRYREAIPIPEGKPIVSFDEGFTPLLTIPLAGAEIRVKQEHLFPSGSFKDRGASVMISHVLGMGIGRVVEDSSGNAGSAVAAYCAAAGIECEIFVPASTSPGKITQIQRYGASLRKIPGSRDDTANAVMENARSVYYASHTWNPFFFHGTKTFAFEVWEQLGHNAPDRLILPVGNGTLLLGAYIGFCELRDAGLINKIPRITAVQAENCAPLCLPGTSDPKFNPKFEPKPTVAEGIAVAAPARGYQVKKAVLTSGGDFLTVSEEEILLALEQMLRKGFYIEPTAATAIAGAAKVLLRDDATGARSDESDEIIVSAFTGHGLKGGLKPKI